MWEDPPLHSKVDPVFSGWKVRRGSFIARDIDGRFHIAEQFHSSSKNPSGADLHPGQNVSSTGRNEIDIALCNIDLQDVRVDFKETMPTLDPHSSLIQPRFSYPS